MAFCEEQFSLYDAWDEFVESVQQAKSDGNVRIDEYEKALAIFVEEVEQCMRIDRFKYIGRPQNNSRKTTDDFSHRNSNQRKKANIMNKLYDAVTDLHDTAEEHRRKLSDKQIPESDADTFAEQSFIALQSSVITVARYETEATNKSIVMFSLFSLLVIIFSAAAAGIAATIITYTRRQKIVAELEQNMKDGQTIVRIQEDERNRMYRELHDTVAQDIRATALFSQQLGNLTGLQQDVAELTKKIALLCRQSLNGIYATISGLAPPELDGSFSDALEMLCTNHRRLTGIPCKRHIDKDAAEMLSTLDTDKKLHIYRIVQEALQNAAKHARPQECSLIVNATATKISLFVTDDGTGFSQDTENLNSRRTFGIFGMKSRAELVGANLSIDSSKEGGTEVKLEIPLSLIYGGGYKKSAKRR